MELVWVAIGRHLKAGGFADAGFGPTETAIGVHHCDTPAAAGWIRRGIGESFDAHPFACHPVSANHAAHVARCTDVLVVARLCRGRRGSPKCHTVATPEKI